DPRLEVAEESRHTAIALLLGTAIASPVLLAALSGRQDPVVALALYLVALVGAWLAVGVFVGAFDLAGRSSAAAELDDAAEPEPVRPTDTAAADPTVDDEEPDRRSATR